MVMYKTVINAQQATVKTFTVLQYLKGLYVNIKHV